MHNLISFIFCHSLKNGERVAHKATKTGNKIPAFAGMTMEDSQHA
jgi:hypothetical protein